MHSQVQEIKAHFELLDKNSRDSNPASQASVKSEPDMDTAPPTPKIARKVRFISHLAQQVLPKLSLES